MVSRCRGCRRQGGDRKGLRSDLFRKLHQWSAPSAASGHPPFAGNHRNTSEARRVGRGTGALMAGRTDEDSLRVTRVGSDGRELDGFHRGAGSRCRRTGSPACTRIGAAMRVPARFEPPACGGNRPGIHRKASAEEDLEDLDTHGFSRRDQSRNTPYGTAVSGFNRWVSRNWSPRSVEFGVCAPKVPAGGGSRRRRSPRSRLERWGGWIVVCRS